MKTAHAKVRPSRAAGFSIVELVVVVAIIAIMAGVVAPPLRTYLRTASIRGAASSVAGELQAARMKAISRNTIFGVSLVTLSTTSFRYVIEDDVTPDNSGKFSGVRQMIATILAAPGTYPNQIATTRLLPDGVVFATVSPNISAVRFGHLGGATTPTTTEIGTAGMVNMVHAPVSGETEYKITLFNAKQQLYKTILVTPGGRIYIKKDFLP